MIETYYDQLAPYYRYIYADWEKSLVRQAQLLANLIQETWGPQAQHILDAACGIGTQCIGLAQLGYTVTAVDVSTAALDLARQEAARRALKLQFIQGDMRKLDPANIGVFDVVLAFDNAIPHLLTEADILLAFQGFAACTTENGGCIISVRDYASMPREGRRFYPRTVHQTPRGRIISFDIWEFDGDFYDFTTYIVEDLGNQDIRTQAIRGGRYYCVTIATLERLLKQSGFSQVMIESEKFHQPVLVGLKRNPGDRA